MTTRSTYRSAPLLLNLERSGETGELQLASTWCNLGLWPAADKLTASRGVCRFREACEALALALGRAASLQSGDAVLDIGVGFADQTTLWPSRFGARRVVGVEPSAEHVAAAKAAQQKAITATTSSAAVAAAVAAVELHVGSAHALPDCCDAGTFDAVLCLDCAYHFRTREAFLRTAHQMLRPGGRFAAADLVASGCGGGSVRHDDGASTGAGGADGRRQRRGWRQLARAMLGTLWAGLSGAWRSVARRAIAALCDIPAANLYGCKEYEARLEAAGLELISLERVTTRVLAPFADHAHRQRAALHGEISWAESASLWVIGALFTFVAHHELFEFVLVSARKPA
jgi:SAM-dependent methyltransferase